MSKSLIQATSLNIYDFDHTIYDGDCSLDFHKYCLRRQPALGMYIPYQSLHYLLFLLGLENRTVFKSRFFSFLKSLKNVDQVVEDFWDTHEMKVKQWYKDTAKPGDIIISASPDFLLRPFVQKRLRGSKLIATIMNAKTGAIQGENCHGKEKVLRFRAVYGDMKVGKMYTDSLADIPLLELAKEPYIVRKTRIERYYAKK